MFKLTDKKIIFKALFFIVMLFMIYPIKIYPINEEDIVNYIPENIEQSNNGGNVTMKSNENNMYNFAINTNGLEQGYYTTYIYENSKCDWSNYEGIEFSIENKTDLSIRMNLNIIPENKTVLSISDNNIVMLNENGDDELKMYNPQYGTFEVPGNFNGTVYIPFNSLRKKGNEINETVRISEINSWGITVTLSENENEEFALGNFKLIKEGSNLRNYFEHNLDITGDKEVEIPTAGEGISDYKVIDKEKNENISEKGTSVEFNLKNNIEGVSLSRDGRLTLYPDAEPQDIEIEAVIDKKISKTTKIKILKSWMLTAKEIDGTIKSIPQENEVEVLMTPEKSAYVNKSIVIFRVILILSILAVVILYWKWKKNDLEKISE